MGKYIDVDGKEYESYEAYCNSPDLDTDIKAVMLATNRRTPQEKWEEDLLREIKELEKKGIPIGFDFN